MKWLLNRLREPSTWAGFAGLIPSLVMMVGGGVTPEAIGGAVAGIAAVLMKEKGASGA